MITLPLIVNSSLLASHVYYVAVKRGTSVFFSYNAISGIKSQRTVSVMLAYVITS